MVHEVNMDDNITIRAAVAKDLKIVEQFLAPFVSEKCLLPRTDDELRKLLENGFLAEAEDKPVGFSAVEIYSKKLAEIQCLAVDPQFRRRGIGKELVKRCVERASERGVLELMAISNSDEMFKACGFDYSLPDQKRALFAQLNLPVEQTPPKTE